MQRLRAKLSLWQDDFEQEWLTSIFLIIAINLLLAITSFLKDVVVAAYLGTTAQADAFLLSYFLIDTVGNNLWASALGVAILPVFSEIIHQRGKGEANRFLGQIFILSVLIGVALMIIFYLLRYRLIDLIGSGMEQSIQHLAATFIEILLPTLLLFPLIGIGIAVLQVDQRYGISALSPVVFNTILLFGSMSVYWTVGNTGVGTIRLSEFILSGVIAQFIFTWYYIRQSYWPQLMASREWSSFKQNMRDINRNFLPYFFVLLSVQITYGVERYLASGLGEGILSALNYSFRIVQFPIWVFVAAISTVAFPTLSRKLHTEGQETFAKCVGQFLYIGLLFTAPLTILLFVLRLPIVSILFERGSFNQESTLITASIMAGYTLTIAWQGFSALLIRVCLLKDNKSLPLFAAVTSMVINIPAAFILVNLWGAKGLGLAAAFGAMTNFLILYLFLRLELGFVIRNKSRYLLPLGIPNIGVMAIALIFNECWSIIQNQTVIVKWGYLGVIGIFCMTVYLTLYILTTKIQKRYFPS